MVEINAQVDVSLQQPLSKNSGCRHHFKSHLGDKRGRLNLFNIGLANVTVSNYFDLHSN